MVSLSPTAPTGAAEPSAAGCRAMVVEDSAIMRGLITRWLQEGGIQVVASYSTGAQAIRNVQSANPDVVVLDIEMPEMDGITALPELLRTAPDARVLMASTLTRRNAEITLRALALGAADAIAKPVATRDPAAVAAFRRELVEKVHALAASRTRSTTVAPAPLIAARPAKPAGLELKLTSPMTPAVLAIGASTGGPHALGKLLGALSPRLRQPVLITQHMPRTFTAILAEHLGRAACRPCAEAADGTPLRAGHVYVAPGDFHMTVARQRGEPVIRLSQEPPENYCRPAVDPLFRSLATEFGPAVLGVILTGMGHDGREGARALVAAGATLLAQDEATSVVWGMPGAVAQAGLCSGILPLDALAPAIERLAAGGRL